MSDATLQQRVDDLEARLAFQEDTIAALNKQVAEQSRDMAKLQLQLQHLNAKIKEDRGGPSEGGDYLDERPPHY